VTLDSRTLGFILAALVVAFAFSFVLTPLVTRLARRLNLLDVPDERRRVHREPIPRGGGIAVAIAFIVVAGVAVWINASTGTVPSSGISGRPVGQTEIMTLLVGVGLAAVLGFIDDRWQIRARWQLLAQLFLAAFVIVMAQPQHYDETGVPTDGILITFVANPVSFLGHAFSSDLLTFAYPVAVALTVLWIVGMINSLNFIDGLDGLSTGVSLIAAVTLGVISLTASQYQPMVALLCAVLAGALAGFLPWNFHPARIFIGTTGVFAVGYGLAVLSILGTAKVAVALLVLGVPIIDTFWIIIRRLANRQSPFTPDRGHFHHRLLDLGLTHRGAVLVIYGLCVLLAVLSLVLSGAGSLYAFMGIVVGGGLVLYLLTRRSQEALDARSYPDEPPVRTDDTSDSSTLSRAVDLKIEDAPRTH